ncbi:MAG: hypothetical protein ACOYJK_07050 [Prevotella sp.]|jgi:hypothetical protein
MRRILSNLIGVLLCQFFVTGVVAQNVTISPKSGKLIAGLSSGTEVGFENGGCSLWRHNQLPLTLTVSDDPDLTEGGQLKNPAGDMGLDREQNLYVIHSGKVPSLHMNISLPKGYRFTGYKIILLNNINGKTIDGQKRVGMNRIMYETGSNFDINSPNATSPVLPSSNDDKEYVIERTSQNVSDMGNNLYFYFDHAKDQFYGATIKSCELYFTAEGNFNTAIAPNAPIADGVNLVGIGFQTSKLDLGPIKPHTKNGKTFYSYNFNNVKDLTAMNYLYQEDAVVGGKLPTNARTGSIQASRTDYRLGNNTYYIETPTSATTQDSKTIPLGYRIVSATLKYKGISSPYKLKVYRTNKNEIYKIVEVAAGESGDVVLENLNNDAIKFTIEGLKGNAKALLTFELTLQALNPFINTMDIVCHSLVEDGPTLMQQFTNNDFQVAGGEFTFYVPKNFIGPGEQKCRFTFENLFSKYGDKTDNTYVDGQGNARYFFVKSPYYNEYGDGKQYGVSGNENASEKNHTTWCGNQPFKYSNIDELDNNNTSASTTSLIEYPYSGALYTDQGGTFTSNIELAVNEEKPCYLFTGDETRWNVAPTTAMEHRYFAYYLMDLKLVTKDYVAKCELTKLYDTTCYDENGKPSEKPMYGGVFKAFDANTGEEISAGNAYLTVPMMKQALIDELKGIDDEDASGKQVLYLDYTNLYSVHIPEKAEMDEMKGALNPNCLIYFPERTSYNENNYIQKTASGDYRACKNIVITDKQPFYAPYKITVPAENYATYTRQITVPKNGKVAHATLVLPFTLSLEEGVHTNATDDGCSFKVAKMTANNCLALDDEYNSPRDYKGKAYFTPLTEDKTEANVPYMVEVTNAPEDEAISFIATQYGSDVMATKGSAMNAKTYEFEGEKATGTIQGTTYNFTNYGSYSGRKLSKEQKLFYFSGNMFLNSKNLVPQLTHLYVYPFRSYYRFSGGAGAKTMNTIDVYFGENSGNITGIRDLENDNQAIALTTQRGAVQIMANEDTVVEIVAVNGMTLKRIVMHVGETATVPLAAGIYVVNGKKVIVN